MKIQINSGRPFHVVTELNLPDVFGYQYSVSFLKEYFSKQLGVALLDVVFSDTISEMIGINNDAISMKRAILLKREKRDSKKRK
ncbi:MAG: hypothetical protein LHV68_09955 [Elusimicrobia bacterium]|nr:hypothetical protein [Candidatus Liberimonas magnetica]